ncbi:MATE family efflux transporter [Blattabacterium cuenoti]|uniref:MATE family efflux transporter n=1 Tax=Blattabacterium cuenoti TaxID=1653831 RepID=UPI001CC252B2|nr:MATE family efflux transporter [Blattabacterium cuenoti]
MKKYLKNFKKNTELALPIFFSQLGALSVNFFDNFMIGLLGKKSLASVSLATSTFFIVIIFGLGISTAISPLITYVDAKKEYKKGAIILFHGLIMNTFLSIIMYIMVYIFSYILPYLGQPKEVLHDSISFLRIISITFVPWMIFEVFRKFSEGLSLNYPSIIVVWSSSILNIILNYVLIKGSFGFPKMGVLGVAYSTLISRIFMLFVMILLLRKQKKVHNYYCNIQFFFKKKYFAEILRIGIPSGFQMLFEFSTFAVSSFISGRCGLKILTAHQIVLNLVSSSYLLSTGLSIAATVRMGQQVALKNYHKLKTIGTSIFLMGIFFMLICSFFFLFFRKEIPRMYIKNDEELFSITEKMIIISSIFQIFDGLQGILMGALRGLQDVQIPMYIIFFSYWIIAIPLAFLLSNYMDGSGVWMGLGIGMTISSILLFIRYDFIINQICKKNIKKNI